MNTFFYITRLPFGDEILSIADIVDRVTTGGSAAIVLLRELLLAYSNSVSLSELIIEKAILQSGVIADVLSNPHFDGHSVSMVTVNTLATITVDEIPEVSDYTRGTPFYGYLVTSTRDLLFIHTSSCSLTYAVIFGYIYPHLDYSKKNISYDNISSLPCITDKACTDEICLKVVSMIFASSTTHLIMEELILESLASVRPAVHYEVRKFYSGARSNLELALISKAEYFDYSQITDENVCMIFNYTPLVEVIEYILKNYNMVLLLSHSHVLLEKDAQHEDYARECEPLPKTRQVGLLKYTLLHQPNKKMTIDSHTTVAEAEILILFPQLEVKYVNREVLKYGSSSVIMRLRELNYNLTQHPEYLKREKLVDV
jgi:hypothetical protein